MPRVITLADLNEGCAILEACALAGERCPLSDGPKAHPNLTKPLFAALVRAGRIKIALSGRSFRQVTLLTGPYAGKKTMAGTSEIYMIFDAAGSRRIAPAKPTRPSRSRVVSAPRVLTREELHR